MKKMSGKKGESSMITIILAILIGLAVLAFLFFGFGRAGGGFLGWINPFSGGNNVDAIKNSCELALSRNSQNDYCLEKKSFKIDSPVKINVVGSCANFYDDSFTVGKLNIGTMSCEKKYEQTCSDLGGKWLGECGSLENINNSVKNSNGMDATKNICCRKIA